MFVLAGRDKIVVLPNNIKLPFLRQYFRSSGRCLDDVTSLDSMMFFDLDVIQEDEVIQEDDVIPVEVKKMRSSGNVKLKVHLCLTRVHI